MKLRYKVLIAVVAIWSAFTALTFIPAIRHSAMDLIGLSAFFALLTFIAVYLLVISKIEQLNQKLITSSEILKLIKAIDYNKKNEVEKLEQLFAHILRAMHSAQHDLKTHKKALADELEKKTLQLQQEISERVTLERKLSGSSQRDMLTQFAHYDTLTTLPNQIFFHEILNKAMNHAKRHKKISAILIVDIDSFRTINSGFNKEIGDQVIKTIAERFTQTLRGEDILARMDSDEFGILLSDINKPKFASSVAEKLLHASAQPIKIANQEILVTVSIGICIYPNDGASLEELIQNAERALNQAKLAGGNGYQFYTQEMDIEAHQFIQLEHALKKAIKKNELVLYYQPKLHIKKGKIAGVEALIRWVHPELGTINPSHLIRLAEETGLSMQIGEWALYEACRINKSWQDEGYEHISIAVNLSPKQFHHPDIVKTINRVLAETQLNPKYLELEIDETTVMDDTESAREILTQIKSTGVLISIDHFGVGHTSISHLKQFPINILKIDQSFIKGLPHQPDDAAITNAVIALGHNLGLAVVASGVETAEQVQYLASQNCDMVQGYFLSHPLPIQKIVGQFKKLSDEVLI